MNASVKRLTPAAALTLFALACVPAYAAGDSPPVAETVTFVVSTGFWEEPAEEADTDTAGAQTRRGYYKLIAVRQADGTAEVHLQQIEATAEGPKIVSSAALEEFSAMKPYVTDIRPENSSGITTQPGFFATVSLKTDPKASEPESWTVLIDDLGEIKIERATN
ncbi:hypothetical protein MNR02_10165 [Shinella sp. H4-D48]|nr:hypothetical protein [Shinella sp. H4-D48]UNK36855.1 hypothetical protein MNR02_10165 [Shinella sp. H4-D48]